MVQLQLVFYVTTNGLYNIQYRHSHGVIATTTLNFHIQPISYEKHVAVAIVPCEQPLRS